MSEDSVREIFHFMGNGDVDVSTDWKGRYKEHLNRMKSGTLVDMATVLKSLYYLSLQKPLSFREKKMMEKAKELIVSEIAVAVASPCSKVEEKLLVRCPAPSSPPSPASPPDRRQCSFRDSPLRALCRPLRVLFRSRNLFYRR